MHIIFNVSAQIPDGYYNSVESFTGNTLKNALHNIIKNHTTYPYTSSTTDVWDILKESDQDPNNPDNVILFYTGWSVNAEQEYNNGSGWSREHVWAKSRGDFGTNPPAGTDAHNLRPVDISVNSARNNRWFDNCEKPYLDGGITTGCFTSDTSWVWQPRDEVKGDVARIICYMATRYEGKNGEPDLEIIDYLPEENNTNDPVHAKLSTLLEWNAEDPVDDFEMRRNDVVYQYQNNRNPFIDHPEYVERIFGESATVGEIINDSEVIVFPNPANDYIRVNIMANKASFKLFDVIGKLMIKQDFSIENPIFVGQLDRGIYFYQIQVRGEFYKGKIVLE